jgi:hypothetical protein
MTSGSSSVTIIVSQGDGSPRCAAGSIPACLYPVHQATYGRSHARGRHTAYSSIILLVSQLADGTGR